jgi:hypothetical protein
MSKQLRASTPKTSSEIKTIKVIKTTKEVHRCTPACFNRSPKPKPPNLRKISLGYLYESDGVLYTKFGKDWMAVVGLEFWFMRGRLHKMWDPAEQMHIHSPGGRTMAVSTSEKEIKTGPKYHARESIKKLKGKGYGRQAARLFLDAEVAKRIEKAPKRKRADKGVGRGAPGQPRSLFSKEVVRLRDEGKSEFETLSVMIDWSRHRGEPVAGSYRNNIKRRVRRWYSPARKNSAHK